MLKRLGALLPLIASTIETQIIVRAGRGTSMRLVITVK